MFVKGIADIKRTVHITFGGWMAVALWMMFILPHSVAAQGQSDGRNYVNQHYTKAEYRIPMRDGTDLYTAVYTPKDTTQDYPIVLKRTPYTCSPYGPEAYPEMVGPNRIMLEEGYIFVCQDVRGRYMSEGKYDNMRPHTEGKLPVDEASDAYDTVEWLLNNIDHHNGKVGQWGISYPGFYTSAALADHHPALKAASPQAPIADFFFDDFHHHGAYFLSYFYASALFGYQKDTMTSSHWFRDKFPELHTRDGYQFYMDLGPLSNADKYYGEDNFMWQNIIAHPNYDSFWKERNILPHLEDVSAAVLTVGGWFDAEDLYGPLNTYRTLEEKNPGIENSLVMGPWSHGQWHSEVVHSKVGDIYFGDSLSHYYHKNIEAPFFRHHLKGGEEPDLPEAYVYDSGSLEWDTFSDWPPEQVEQKKLFLKEGESLSWSKPRRTDSYTEYVSDPHEPVPYTDDIRFVFTPQKYMTEDQRFAGRRQDVITFISDTLEQDLTLAGDMLANLYVSTNKTAADWVVKLIDVYPPSVKEGEHTAEDVELDNYWQMVRSEVIRGRFRDSYSDPKPFEPGKITYVDLPLQDVYHTFEQGHRIMIQVQSTWFPLVDRNPQSYVPNIFKADSSDFVEATHRVYHSNEHPTNIEVKVLKEH